MLQILEVLLAFEGIPPPPQRKGFNLVAFNFVAVICTDFILRLQCAHKQPRRQEQTVSSWYVSDGIFRFSTVCPAKLTSPNSSFFQSVRMDTNARV